MKKKYFAFLGVLVISACGQTSSTSDKKPMVVEVKSSSKSTETNHPTKDPTTLDSIDKAHNNSVVAAGDNITKAFVFLKDGDSTITLAANIRRDYRIFGYAQPDIKSERLLLLSVFTNDVENNPFSAKLGAFYDTGGMDELTLKYISTTGNFIKASATDKRNKSTTIYFEKKLIEFM